MKSLIIALVFGISISGFAQVSTPQPGGNNSEKMTPEQRQEKQLKHLTKELGLDAKQQEAVGKILAEKSDKVQDLKSKKEAKKESGEKLTIGEKKALKTSLKTEKADTETQMKAVLSADQYTKWQTMREEKKEKIMEKRKEKKEQM
jgi:periplasmic protein CpxP/Spy